MGRCIRNGFSSYVSGVATWSSAVTFPLKKLSLGSSAVTFPLGKLSLGSSTVAGCRSEVISLSVKRDYVRSYLYISIFALRVKTEGIIECIHFLPRRLPHAFRYRYIIPLRGKRDYMLYYPDWFILPPRVKDTIAFEMTSFFFTRL